MIKIGKVTSGLLMLAVGTALLADKTMDTNYLGYAEQGWPLVLVALGLEHLWVNLKYANRNERIRFDVGGLLAAALIAAAAVAYSQYGWPPSKWFDGLSNEFGSLMPGHRE